MPDWLKTTCPECGRETVAYVPEGGDGSGFRLRKHKPPTITPTTITCQGSFALYTLNQLKER